jgi:hypothetical protein
MKSTQLGRGHEFGTIMAKRRCCGGSTPCRAPDRDYRRRRRHRFPKLDVLDGEEIKVAVAYDPTATHRPSSRRRRRAKAL